MGSLNAKLRVCASCEWVFKINPLKDEGCPKCGFAHYGARYVYGDKAYRFLRTQTPWFNKKIAIYRDKLRKEIG